MSPGAPSPTEYIDYRRSPALPGLELLDARHSPREWRAVGYGYGVSLLRTWRGQIAHRGQQGVVAPGFTFCNYPDEAMIATPEPGSVGSFQALIVDQELLKEWVDEHRPATGLEWRALFPRISDALSAKFLRLSGALEFGASALELQSESAEFAEALVREFVAGSSNHRPATGPALRGTARMRERLHEADFDVNLETLAREAGLSRFQALRAFKRRYGLPPHAYQLYLRVSRARLMLRAGATPAQAAAHFGFGDQSHMTRHFKRIVGVTPGQYALGQVASTADFGVQGNVR